MSQTYVSLHTHSSGSFLDGYSNVESIAKRAKSLGMEAVAITDHGECNQHLAFQKACEAEGVKPIFGMEGYLVDSVERVRNEKDRENSHICLFAENDKGLSNLWTISSKAYIEGRYYKPLATWELFKEYSEGIIATDGCMLAYMARAIMADDVDRQEELLGRYVDTFGEDNFFIELHTWQFIDPQTEREVQLNADMTKINQGKMRIAQKYGIPMIVVNDAHYACEHEWEHHALVWQMSTFTKGDDKTEPGKTASWIMSDEEVIHYMSLHGIPVSVTKEAIANTARIAARCNARIVGKDTLPSLTGTPEGDLELFLSEVEKGFQRRIAEGNMTEDDRPRINYELSVIVPKQFPGYFLVVWDYVTWAKDVAKMLVGPGRGSGGGSAVAYALRITEINPIKYELPFERFITLDRMDLPDFDIDFPRSRRGEVIQYLRDKYGNDHVCAVGTLSRSKPKGILKDLCRAMDISFDDAKEMSLIIEQVSAFEDDEDEDTEDLTWGEIIKLKGGDLSKWQRKYPELFDKMEDMIGLIRQSSSHASAILISKDTLYGNLPLRIKGSDKETDHLAVSQFEASEKYGAEIVEMGYVKFDFLGLRHLDTLEEARQLVLKRHGKWIDYYSFGDAEYADPAIYEETNKGESLGLFQIETKAMEGVSKRFDAMNERDIADLISVNRPGVIDAGMLEPFLKRRAGTANPTTPHPLMSDILAPTFGVVMYQEQVMKLCVTLANYTPSEAEKIRKIMGKKLVDQMAVKKPEFIQRCADNPEFTSALPRGAKAADIAQRCWDNIEPSAGYSFNQAHAQAYALISCWGAWMRYYYPEEYETALLSTDSEKIPKYISWCRKNGIQILPPDINDSGEHFSLTEDGIRYGLTTVANVGAVSYREISQKRPFSSFDHLMDSVSKGAFNSRVGVNLISIGALDRFGDRTELYNDFVARRKIKDKFAPDFYDDNVVGQIEKDLIGSYITKNPMNKYEHIVEAECEVQTLDDMQQLIPGEVAHVGGLLVGIKRHRTKAGKPMAWLTLDWKGELFEVVMFPRQYEGYKSFLLEDKPVIIQVDKLENGCCVRDFVRLDRLGI